MLTALAASFSESSSLSPVNLSPKLPNLDKIATETLFVGNDSHTHPEQHIKNIDDRMQAKVA